MYGRSWAIFGWLVSSALMFAGIALLARRWAGQRAERVDEVVGRAVAVQDQPEVLNTGTDSSATVPSLRRKGVSPAWVASPVATISGSRSSSAARRLTKVVFAWRRAGGRATSERSNESFSCAIAPSA